MNWNGPVAARRTPGFPSGVRFWCERRGKVSLTCQWFGLALNKREEAERKRATLGEMAV
jgi:hypothetical protein